MTTFPLAARVIVPVIALVAAAWIVLTPAGAQESNTQSTIEGDVTSVATGAPIQGAIVTDGTAIAVTGADGLFTLETGEQEPTILIRAAGFADWRQQLDPTTGARLNVALDPQEIRALYLKPEITNTQDQFERLVDVIDTTNANAVVIDIKEEWVWYDTNVEFFQDAGSVDPVLDLSSLLTLFHEHDIYTIARLVLFKDSIVAEAFPDLAIKDAGTGQPWRDQNGVAWVNPMNNALWQPNIDLAVEAANLGFDEIQYDYIRFPTDGDLSTMDFGSEYTETNRELAIEEFLTQSRDALLPTGARQSADIFGYTLVVDDDMGIGQNALHLAGLVDYLSPMLYPSHYSVHQFGLAGHPNEYPYDTVAITLDYGIAKLDGNAAIFRPWLQDFGYPGLRDYTAWDVREQIRAADEAGTSGWMLWDPDQLWRTDRLEPAGIILPVADSRQRVSRS
jgi:hypothetical protein